MPRPCKCNWRPDQGIGDISRANPLLSARSPNVIMGIRPFGGWQNKSPGPAGQAPGLVIEWTADLLQALRPADRQG